VISEKVEKGKKICEWKEGVYTQQNNSRSSMRPRRQPDKQMISMGKKNLL